MKKLGWAAACAAALCLMTLLPWRRPIQAAANGPEGLLVWIELDRMRLTVYENGEPCAVYPIAAGARDTPSPVGVFRVNSRFATELSGFGTRFLGLNVPWGRYGIHGTNAPASIGQNASHGCIRMRVKDAEALYRLIPTGTKVVIEGGPYGALYQGLRTLKDGDRGADVRLLQQRLIQQGFLHGSADGVFGASTRQAVIAARRHFSLPLTDRADHADPALQLALGMLPFD